MGAIRTSNNPEMLIWAREEVGYTIEQAAKALGISIENLKAAEAGERPLTLHQLRKAADMYSCPYGFFYLSKPPYSKTFKPVPDFRVEPGHEGLEHYRLNLEIKKARDQRLVFIDLAEKLNTPIEPFQLFSDFSAEDLGTKIRNRLKIDDSEISSLSFDQSYPYWKSKIENDGVLVYESQYIPSESGVIGVAIFYETYPIILIKRGGSSNARKLFTLLHEYSHLLKGVSAINDAEAQTIEQTHSAEEELEVECNRVAAEILVPSEKINLPDYKDLGLVDKMEYMATEFKVTYTTAAVCLKRLNLIDKAELAELLVLRHKEYLKNQAKKKKDVKIPRENIMKLDLGRPMFDMVLRAYGNGTLDVFDASKLLSLRVNKIDKLVSEMY